MPSVNGETAALDREPFIAMQRWLDLAGKHRVTIPYAYALAKLVPNRYVRMRRDFRQALTVIQAVAVLHQQQRSRDPAGRIVADLDDYRIARELLLDTFNAAATGGLSVTVRKTVEALLELYDGEKPVTAKALGDAMGVAKDTAWHRVRRAVELGLITNLETRKGQPAKLIPADALPEEHPAMPSVEEVQALMCGNLTETDSTVQPLPEDQSDDEPEGAVETGVEPALQPDFQPPLTLTSDSEPLSGGAAVERLNASGQEEHIQTEGEGDRVYAFALAQELGFPPVQLRAGLSVVGTEEGWGTFLATAPPELLRGAIAVLEDWRA